MFLGLRFRPRYFNFKVSKKAGFILKFLVLVLFTPPLIMKLFLVRYGEHVNGHLNKKGKQTMILASKLLQPLIQNEKACILCANTTRAIESAEVISKYLKKFPVQDFQELYAAKEDGVNVDLEAAVKVINSAGIANSLVIAVVSREYIETLPDYILRKFGFQEAHKVDLARGEILVLDYNKKNITYLKSGI